MLKIAVIEDNQIQSCLLRDYVNEWLKVVGEVAEVVEFSSGEQFLFEFEDFADVNIILLDIQMSRINGVDLAKKVRLAKSDASIIFITGIPDYMQDGYDVEALHYLLKPVKKEKLFACLNRAVKKNSRAVNESLVFSCDGRTVIVEQKEILFVESVGHNLKIKTLTDEYLTRMNLGELEKKLSAGLFVKTHRAFVVNLMHIKQIQKEKIFLEGGVEVPVSRREYKNVNNLFIRFFTAGEN